MPSFDIHRPGMEDLQFVLFVVALCTSEVRTAIFDRCWAVISTDPPPTEPTKRVHSPVRDRSHPGSHGRDGLEPRDGSGHYRSDKGSAA